MESENRHTLWKSSRSLWQNVPYYLVQVVLVAVVALPTIFYIFQPDHPSHATLNETFPIQSQENNNQTSRPEIPVRCNSPLVFDQESGQCRPLCNWTSQSALTQRLYYGIVVTGFWLILIAAVITFITWVNIKNLRKFPHVLRFHIIVCCIILACCKMIPIRIGLGKTFCREEMYWQPLGHASSAAVLLGATSHYFGLALSFWVTCFIANAYAVIVHHKRAVFKHPSRIHFIQSLLCWVGPAVIVACCLLVDPPGYTFLFVDLLAAGPTSTRRAYFSATLPRQVTLVLSLCLLWAIVWHLRKARLDKIKRVIRPKEETISMRRVERQFLSMAMVMLLLVGVVLVVNTVIIYTVNIFYHEAEVYFHCLQTSTDCKSPRYNIVLPLINVVAPGFLCLVFFFLLFANKECRQIWKACLARPSRIFQLCKPPQRRLNETDRSRSSTLTTTLYDRKETTTFSENVKDPRLNLSRDQLHPSPSLEQSRIFAFRMEKPRSSNLPITDRRKKFPVKRDTVIKILVSPPPDELETRPRSNSLPSVFFPSEKDTQVAAKHNKNRTKSMNRYRDFKNGSNKIRHNECEKELLSSRNLQSQNENTGESDNSKGCDNKGEADVYRQENHLIKETESPCVILDGVNSQVRRSCEENNEINETGTLIAAVSDGICSSRM
ncbi:uncharacterized protein LOC122960942 [Acropora millepora]|uniref:uncharacterized protein LOC122960942 n=1 Tax=Acropora millepora TaxID=45264 RepID=UPI001CF462AC|nr:uncharacterized protein LOC122960942 [Acropora millepora]